MRASTRFLKPSKMPFPIDEVVELNPVLNPNDQNFQLRLHSGIMFSFKVSQSLPVHYVKLSSLCFLLANQVNRISVWAASGTYKGIFETRSQWHLVHKSKVSSVSENGELHIQLMRPLVLHAGAIASLYVHIVGGSIVCIEDKSPLAPGVLDKIVCRNEVLEVHSGLGHAGFEPFQRRVNNGWSWRPSNCFAGALNLGVRYLRFSPLNAHYFPQPFLGLARELLLCRVRNTCTLSLLPREIMYYILRMIHWEWPSPGSRID